MTKIVAFSGRKQAGKNTAGNFLFGLQMWSILHPETKEPLISQFRIDEQGRLIIPVDFGDDIGIQEGIFDPTSREPAVQIYLSQWVWPVVKMYSFADALKGICQHLFGITDSQLYGNNDQKNTYTELVWKNMPGLPKTKTKIKPWLTSIGFNLSEEWTPESLMTAREVLQYAGTNIFRKMHDPVWANATLKNIFNDEPEIAIITDCRFPNEIEAVQKHGGKVIRLTRAPFAGQDEHSSETELDLERFDWSKFDAVIDNKEMTIEQQNEAVFNELVRLEIINTHVEEEAETEAAAA